MKKAVILEEGDYNLVMSALNAAQDVLNRMRNTKNAGYLNYYVSRAIELLTSEDSSTRDLKDCIKSLEPTCIHFV